MMNPTEAEKNMENTSSHLSGHMAIGNVSYSKGTKGYAVIGSYYLWRAKSTYRPFTDVIQHH